MWLTGCLLLASLTLPLHAYSKDKNASLVVFAAASLTEPLTAIGQTYTQQSGVSINFSFAASSTLARQISSGANPDIYLSANTRWMQSLHAQGLLEPASRRPLLSNTLVVATSAQSALAAFSLDENTDFAALLSPGERIAVGDPDHVPVGMYTKRSLMRLGLWSRVEPLLARTDNTRATVALLERGEAPFGFVYRSDTSISPNVKILAEVPGAETNPIMYEIAIVKNASDSAKEFVAFLHKEAAREIFSGYQFIPIDN